MHEDVDAKINMLLPQYHVSQRINPGSAVEELVIVNNNPMGNRTVR